MCLYHLHSNLLRGAVAAVTMLLALLPLRADDTHLDFHPYGDGEPAVYMTSKLTRIDFRPDGMLGLHLGEQSGEGNVSLVNPANLSKIVFSTQPTHSTAMTEAVEPRPNLYPNPATDYFSVAGIEDVSLVVVTLSGVSVREIAHYKGEPVDVSVLPSGLYIIKAGKFTFKLIKK